MHIYSAGVKCSVGDIISCDNIEINNLQLIDFSRYILFNAVDVADIMYCITLYKGIIWQ